MFTPHGDEVSAAEINLAQNQTSEQFETCRNLLDRGQAVYLVGLHDVHRVHGGLLQDALILQQRPHRLFHPAKTAQMML